MLFWLKIKRYISRCLLFANKILLSKLHLLTYWGCRKEWSTRTARDYSHHLRFIVVSGIVESTDAESTERPIHDSIVVKDILNHLEVEDLPQITYRFGKPQEVRPRLLKVVFPKSYYQSLTKQKKERSRETRLARRSSYDVAFLISQGNQLNRSAVNWKAFLGFSSFMRTSCWLPRYMSSMCDFFLMFSISFRIVYRSNLLVWAWSIVTLIHHQDILISFRIYMVSAFLVTFTNFTICDEN